MIRNTSIIIILFSYITVIKIYYDRPARRERIRLTTAAAARRRVNGQFRLDRYRQQMVAKLPTSSGLASPLHTTRAATCPPSEKNKTTWSLAVRCSLPTCFVVMPLCLLKHTPVAAVIFQQISQVYNIAKGLRCRVHCRNRPSRVHNYNIKR